MKTTSIQYAQALLEITDGKEKEEIHKSVREFVRILRRRHALDTVHRIVSLYKELFDEKYGIVPVTVFSSFALSDKECDKIRNFVASQYPQAREIRLNKKRDEKRIGGVTLEIGDERIDMSISNTLTQFKRTLLGR